MQTTIARIDVQPRRGIHLKAILHAQPMSQNWFLSPIRKKNPTELTASQIVQPKKYHRRVRRDPNTKIKKSPPKPPAYQMNPNL